MTNPPKSQRALVSLWRVMRPVVVASLLVSGSVQTLALAADSGTKYSLYFLGGQSNMEGFGNVGELRGDWLGETDRVMIYTGRMVADNETGGGVGTWEKLQPGHGTGFTTDGETSTLSNTFGPELSFGRRMAALRPSSRIAIIKYSRGGSSLQTGASGFGTWEPDFKDGNGINQYDNALTAIRLALSSVDIDADGLKDTLVPAGIIWMQGESDAYHSQESALAYRHNLERMMGLLRAALRVDDLPVVIGKITDSGQDEDGSMMDYIKIVQYAQQQFVVDDACAKFVDVTDSLTFSDDGWHYNTQGYLLMGTAFAEAANQLESHCGGRD